MTPPKTRKTAAAGSLIGYARVSTDEQGTDPQLDELRAAGCATILEEHAFGADRSRPVLARLLRDIRAGETRWWSSSIVSTARSAICWSSSTPHIWEGVLAGLDTWLPTARRIRPDQPCGASCRS